MFIDKVTIKVKSGDGGDGCVSMRREKYVPKGGPDGGDGGRGGDLIFVADPGIRTLLDFAYNKKYFAGNGSPGSGNNSTGANGSDLVIKVPVGTIIKNEETGEVIADIYDPGVPHILLRGGRGGKGNARFATSTRQTPEFSQPGQKTKQYTVTLELKSIADVGLVGYPNVGKSTLLSVITAARPKIANYQFTTLSPNLGVASVDGYSFIVADIPGLIENAHEGVGLGHEFLRHIERTRLIVHVLDAAGIEGRNPVDDYKSIRNELGLYSSELTKRPEIIAANKSDLPDSQAGMELLGEFLDGKKIFPISAATGAGIKELMREVAAQLKELPVQGPVLSEMVPLDKRIGDEYSIEERDGVYFIEGTLVDRLLDSVNLYDRHSMAHFQKMLDEYGIVAKLRMMGAKDGDTISFGDTEFDFVE